MIIILIIKLNDLNIIVKDGEQQTKYKNKIKELLLRGLIDSNSSHGSYSTLSKEENYVLVDDVGTTDFTMPGDAGGGTKGPDVDAYWDETMNGILGKIKIYFYVYNIFILIILYMKDIIKLTFFILLTIIFFFILFSNNYKFKKILSDIGLRNYVKLSKKDQFNLYNFLETKYNNILLPGNI